MAWHDLTFGPGPPGEGPMNGDQAFQGLAIILERLYALQPGKEVPSKVMFKAVNHFIDAVDHLHKAEMLIRKEQQKR